MAGREEDVLLQRKDDEEVEDARKATEAEEARKEDEAEAARKEDEVEAAHKVADAEDAPNAVDAEDAHRAADAEETRKEDEMEGVCKMKVKKSRKHKAPEDGFEADKEGAARRTARARKTPAVRFIDPHYGLSDFNLRRLKQNVRRNWRQQQVRSGNLGESLCEHEG
jgi:hypothetical protein